MVWPSSASSVLSAADRLAVVVEQRSDVVLLLIPTAQQIAGVALCQVHPVGAVKVLQRFRAVVEPVDDVVDASFWLRLSQSSATQRLPTA